MSCHRILAHDLIGDVYLAGRGQVEAAWIGNFDEVALVRGCGMARMGARKWSSTRRALNPEQGENELRMNDCVSSCGVNEICQRSRQ